MEVQYSVLSPIYTQKKFTTEVPKIAKVTTFVCFHIDVLKRQKRVSE